MPELSQKPSPGAAGMSWPDRSLVSHLYDGRQRYYRTPDGVFPGTTTILKVLGLSTEALVGWSARMERRACLAAAAEAYGETLDSIRSGDAPQYAGNVVDLFVSRIGAKLQGERAHAKALEKAADIGTQVHERIRWALASQIGEERGPEPQLTSEAALRAYMSFTDWWSHAGLTPVRVEQPLWDPHIGYAGTADLIARDEAIPGNVVIDFKSGAGIYLEHHLQAWAYHNATQRWGRTSTALLVRLPKKTGETFEPERDLEELGNHRWGKRQFTEQELGDAFRAAVIAWNILMRNPKFQPERMEVVGGG